VVSVVSVELETLIRVAKLLPGILWGEFKYIKNSRVRYLLKPGWNLKPLRMSGFEQMRLWPQFTPLSWHLNPFNNQWEKTWFYGDQSSLGSHPTQTQYHIMQGFWLYSTQEHLHISR
jgi:hypothetical protein